MRFFFLSIFAIFPTCNCKLDQLIETKGPICVCLVSNIKTIFSFSISTFLNRKLLIFLFLKSLFSISHLISSCIPNFYTATCL